MEHKTGARISQRWIFTIMAFLGLWIGNGLRVSLSITITEMVMPVDIVIKQSVDTCEELESHRPRNISIETKGKHNWDEYTQGIILSSYFWGYAVTQLPFGTLSERFGGKYLLGFSILIPSLMTFLTPIVIEIGGPSALIAIRVIMGIASGAMYPSASTMISRWTTSLERTKIGSIVFAGGIVGTVFGTTVPAIIIRYSSLGWPAVFYIFGLIGMVWFPIWVLLCYDNPDLHPFISIQELEYLHNDIDGQKKIKLPPAPWRIILKSKEFWAFVISLVGCDYAYFTMANDLPKYMSSIVKFSIENNGYLSSLPYLCMWFNTILSSWISEQIIDRQWLSITNTRKLLTTISLSISTIFLLGASYAGCDQFLVVLMFIIGMTLMGSSYPSIMINALDLSPNYSGTLMSIGNSIAAIGGIITPYIIGILTPEQTIGEWRQVFWIVFAVAILANIYFLMFASAEVQEWNNPNYLMKKKKIMINSSITNKSTSDEENARS